MKIALLAALDLVLAAEAVTTPDQGAAANAPRPDPRFAEITDDPRLPRVLLIGDSISIGYTLPTRALLAGKANLHRIPENGGPTIRGLERLEAWLGTSRWDVIHFNWGLHDLRSMPEGNPQVTLADYEKNLRQLVQRLKQTGATLIWASTTPVPDAVVNPSRRNSDVLAYNAAAKQIMAEYGVLTDDLYTAAFADLANLQIPANVHFTPAGSEALAVTVAASIEAALPRLASAQR